MEIQTQFKIPRPNEARFLDAIKKLNKTAAKVGVSEATVSLLRYEANHEYNSKGRQVLREYAIYEIRGERPKMNGWRFLASVEVMENGNFLRIAPGQEVAKEWHSAAMKCEHCEVDRNRKAYFLVGNEAGEVKSVGSSCVKDFTGHKSPQAIASWFGFWAEIAKSEEYDDGFGGESFFENRFLVKDMITLAMTIIRIQGFLSNKTAHDAIKPRASTADDVRYVLCPPTGADAKEHWRKYVDQCIPTEEDKNAATAVEEWLLAQDSSNFLMNLSILVKEKAADASKAGFLAAGAWQAAKALNLTKYSKVAGFDDREKENNWIGNVGDKLEFSCLTVVGVKHLDGQYGRTTMLMFEDDNGNSIKWFASKDLDIDVGEKFSVKGSVKKHGEWKDRKETLLQRCKLTRIQESVSV